jgi:hypothetical protein
VFQSLAATCVVSLVMIHVGKRGTYILNMIERMMTHVLYTLSYLLRWVLKLSVELYITGQLYTSGNLMTDAGSRRERKKALFTENLTMI